MAKSALGNLKKNRQKGKIAGVCAGIAEHFGWEVWLVRVITVSLFLLGAKAIVLIGYVVLWLVLEDAPKTSEQDVHIRVKTKFWQSGNSASDALQNIEAELEKCEQKVRQLERFVTSDGYKLKKEIGNL